MEGRLKQIKQRTQIFTVRKKEKRNKILSISKKSKGNLKTVIVLVGLR